MTVEEVSMIAYRNERPETSEMNPLEWLLWYQLREVYQHNRSSPENGAREKSLVVKQFEKNCSEWVSMSDVHQYLATFWKDIENPAREYATNQNAETARKFFEAVYKVPVKDQITYWEREGEMK